MSKHIDRTQEVHIDIDDHEYGRSTAVHVRKGRAATAIAGTGIALTALAVGVANHDHDPAVHGSYLEQENVGGQVKTGDTSMIGQTALHEPKTVSYTVKRNEFPSTIADKFSANHENYEALLSEVVGQEVEPPVLPEGLKLTLDTEYLSHDAKTQLEHLNPK